MSPRCADEEGLLRVVDADISFRARDTNLSRARTSDLHRAERSAPASPA
jgi:hypothetical protein